MPTSLASLDAYVGRLLRSPVPRVSGREALLIGTTLGLGYGFVMGTFSGLWDGRTLQLLYSAVKVPLLLGVTSLIAMPAFFVLNTLAGVGGDFRQVLRALLATQAGVSVVLAALAPVTFFWYAGNADYPQAILANAVAFGLASLAGQVLLTRYYRPLERQNPVHRRLRWLWIALYAFVGVQMGWVLRPFIGQPGSEEQFFREGAWGNAYVELFAIALRAVGV